MISSAWRFISPADGGTVPRMPSMPARKLSVGQPVAIEAVVDRGRAEVPQDRQLVAGKQREAAELVALPLADLGAGEVADVVDVEGEQRAAVRNWRAPAAPGQAVVPQPGEIDPPLEIHAHMAGLRNRPVPLPMRIGVLLTKLFRREFLPGGAAFRGGSIDGSGAMDDGYSKTRKKAPIAAPAPPSTPRMPSPAVSRGDTIAGCDRSVLASFYDDEARRLLRRLFRRYLFGGSEVKRGVTHSGTAPGLSARTRVGRDAGF